MKHRTRDGRLTEELLKRYPNCRNSDSDLIIGILHAHGVFLSQHDRDIIRGINFESITRMRRKLQNAGEYIPTDPEVARRRKIKGFEIQQTAPGLDAAQLQKRIQYG